MTFTIAAASPTPSGGELAFTGAALTAQAAALAALLLLAGAGLLALRRHRRTR